MMMGRGEDEPERWTRGLSDDDEDGWEMMVMMSMTIK